LRNRGGLRLGIRIDPAGMNPSIKRLGHLGVDFRAKTGQATKCRLDVATGTAEAVVEIQMPKGGIEIVVPHQAHHAATEPDAFRVSGWPVDGLGRLDELVGLALIILGGIRRICRRLARLFLGAKVAALSDGASNTDQEGEPGDGEKAQNRMLELKHPSTHKFPELLPAWPALTRWFDAVQMGPQYGGDTPRNPMTDISDFVQQSHNFITLW
jgi:hypothetical protein